MAVNPLQDIMNHYLWSFSAYLLALAIILLNTAHSMYSYLRGKYRPLYSKHSRLGLLISLLCGMSLVTGPMFQGVLAGSNAPDIYYRSSYFWMVCLVSLVLFVVQIVSHIKTPSIRPGVEPANKISALRTAPQGQSRPQAPSEQPVISQEDSVSKDEEQR